MCPAIIHVGCGVSLMPHPSQGLNCHMCLHQGWVTSWERKSIWEMRKPGIEACPPRTWRGGRVCHLRNSMGLSLVSCVGVFREMEPCAKMERIPPHKFCKTPGCLAHSTVYDIVAGTNPDAFKDWVPRAIEGEGEVASVETRSYESNIIFQVLRSAWLISRVLSWVQQSSSRLVVVPTDSTVQQIQGCAAAGSWNGGEEKAVCAIY